jgi:hypothetical protein
MAVALFAGDVKGTWTGQVNRPDGAKETDVVLELSQDGESITGKIGSHADDMVPLQNAKLDGDKLTFEVAASEALYLVTLNIDGNTAKGAVIRNRDGQSSQPMPMELKRSQK